MLRITPIESSDHYIILRLEGRIAGPWVTELWNACEEPIGEGKALVLNLAEVSFLDNAGVNLLTRIHARGIVLADCSPFVAEQLKGAG